MVVEGRGLQNLLNNWSYLLQICSPKSCWILAPFFSGFLLVLDHFWSHFGRFLDHFWRLGMTLGDFCEILGIVWLQLKALGCNLVALGSHFGFRNLPWLVFGRKLPKKWAVPLRFSKIALKSERIVREWAQLALQNHGFYCVWFFRCCSASSDTLFFFGNSAHSQAIRCLVCIALKKWTYRSRVSTIGSSKLWFLLCIICSLLLTLER